MTPSPVASTEPSVATSRFAEVVFNLPLDRGFHYAIPAELSASAAPGARVLASFGPRRLVGYIVARPEACDVAGPKPILRVFDDEPALTEDLLRLGRWMAAYYACSLGEAYATMVGTAFRRRALADAVAESRPAPAGPPLTPAQAAALEAIHQALDAGRHEVMLVHGVTGSGKTELYLRAIQRALEQGRGAICLVPEIALTPQTVDRFRERFGEEVVLWHSRLTAKQRAEGWERLRRGRSRVIVGTRSAAFAPLPRLGVLVLDEEHDPSYKQDSTPRYHARDVAIARARDQGAVVLLGSATPSIESYHLARQGRYRLLELPERIHGRPMPPIELIDLRSDSMRGRKVPISLQLELAMLKVLERNEQAILMLNRRGFARAVTCPGCGIVLRCPECTVPMIYHARPPALLCHYCGKHEPPPERCPSCRKAYLRYKGSGTERIESELHRMFPGSDIGRMDADTTKARESHRELYDALRGEQIHLLVGTQMVAKGLDLPQVTLVGVVNADTSLNLPDFRAGERTYSLLTQVAGRAGRGEQPGTVLIQSYCPEHYAIQAVAKQDYRAFFETELEIRQRLRLPPATHLIELTVQGRNADLVRTTTEHLAEALRRVLRAHRVTILGPAPHRVETIRKLARWRLILKVAQVEPVTEQLRHVLGPSRKFEHHQVIVDVDPQ